MRLTRFVFPNAGKTDDFINQALDLTDEVPIVTLGSNRLEVGPELSELARQHGGVEVAS